MISNKIIFLSLLGFACVYSEAPCSHNVKPEQAQYQASSNVPKYEPVPAAQEILNREYLPPTDYSVPQANQAAPVYIKPPQPQPQPQPSLRNDIIAPQPLPRLPQASVIRPVSALPKLQPLPSTVRPQYVAQPLPSTVRPQYVAQPLPSTVRPQYVAQPLPRLQPFPSTQKPFIAQPPVTRSPAPLPKFSLPPLKPLSPIVPKQFAPIKTFQPKENAIAQSTNVQPKVLRPDLEPAAQTNRLNFINPQVNPDNIKINHYICEQGDPQQKFLCDILKLWDINHPKEILSNDLDNPVDPSNLNPTIAKLPSSPRPTFAPLPSPTTPRAIYTPPPTTTTTTTSTTEKPEPENDIVPGDSMTNENALYLPPYSTSPSTTVEIPKRVVAPSNRNVNIITPDETEVSPSTLPYSTTTEPTTTTTTTTVAPKEEGYEYPKPSVPFPVPEKEGYEYPKPSIPFPVPEKSGYNYPSPAISSFPEFPSFSTFSQTTPAPILGSPISLDSRYIDNLNQFSPGFPSFASFSNSIQYQPLISSTPAPVVTSTTIAPEIVRSEFVGAPAFGYNYQPFQSVQSFSAFNAPVVTYTDNSLSSISPFAYSTPAPPAAISYSSGPEFYSYSTPAPPVISYSSQPAFSQSLSTLAPLLLSKESLTLSSTPAPLSFNSFSTTSSSDKSPKSSTEKSTVTTTPSTPLPASFGSSQLNTGFNSFSSQYNPISYSSFPSSFDPSFNSFSTVSPLSYSFDNSLNSFNSFPYSGQSFSTISPLFPQSFPTASPLSVQSVNVTEKAVVPPSAPGQPISGFSSQTFGSQSFGQVSNSLPSAFNFNPQPLEQRTNITSFNFQQLPAQTYSAQDTPTFYNFQPLGGSVQSFNFPSSFSAGLSQPQPSGPGQNYPPSAPSSFNIPNQPQYDGSLSGQSQSSSSSQNSDSSASFSKSGLSFGSNVQSVANLKDLQATAKTTDFELKSESYSKGNQAENNLFAASFSQGKLEEAPRRTGSFDNKEDISLGNIEILKVKRKSSTKNL